MDNGCNNRIEAGRSRQLLYISRKRTHVAQHLLHKKSNETIPQIIIPRFKISVNNNTWSQFVYGNFVHLAVRHLAAESQKATERWQMSIPRKKANRSREIRKTAINQAVLRESFRCFFHNVEYTTVIFIYERNSWCVISDCSLFIASCTVSRLLYLCDSLFEELFI